MFRKELQEMLQERALTVQEIARATGESAGTIAADLAHLKKSLKHTALKMAVTPAQCRKCGFDFGRDKLRKPSKCPECRSSWISEPRIAVVPEEN